MISIDRLQSYLRWSAERHYESVAVPPFTLFFHPSDALTFFNYAIPDGPVAEQLDESLDQLRREFHARERRPRFEFVENFAPDLAAALREHGFVEESRTQLMVCTPETFRIPDPISGLGLTRLTQWSSREDVRAFLETQRRGFGDGADESVTETAVDTLRARLPAPGGVFLARFRGDVAAAGGYSAPHEGLTEITGVTTLGPFRRRGIASMLTSQAVRAAFAEGADVAVLSAADERAGRVYERIGFRPHTAMLAYIDAAPE